MISPNQPELFKTPDHEDDPGAKLLHAMREALKAGASTEDMAAFHARLGDWLGRRIKIERPAECNDRRNPDGSNNSRYLLGAPFIKIPKAEGLRAIGLINRGTSVIGTVAALELEQNGRITLERADMQGPKTLSTGLLVVEQLFEDALTNTHAPYENRLHDPRELQARFAISKVEV